MFFVSSVWFDSYCPSVCRGQGLVSSGDARYLGSSGAESSRAALKESTFSRREARAACEECGGCQMMLVIFTCSWLPCRQLQAGVKEKSVV